MDQEQTESTVDVCRRAGPWLILVCLLGLLAACAEPARDPRSEIRALIGQAEEAAEDRNAGDLLDLLTNDYRDPSGLSREDLERRLKLLFLRHQQIHLFTRITDIRISEAGGADASVLVAMAGEPVSEDDVVPLRASFYRFDLRLIETEPGQWGVQSVRWRQATRADFLPS